MTTVNFFFFFSNRNKFYKDNEVPLSIFGENFPIMQMKKKKKP